jgi:hypothetical protein
MAVSYSPQYYYTAISGLNSQSSSLTHTQQLIEDLSGNIERDINTIDISTDIILSQVNEMSLNVDGSTTQRGISHEDRITTSNGMYNDSRNRYITKLLENYLLFISICGLSYGIYKSDKTE